MTTDTFITLMDLEELEEYEISIAAYTIVGIGPYSDNVTITTAQTGMSTVRVSLVS